MVARQVQRESDSLSAPRECEPCQRKCQPRSKKGIAPGHLSNAGCPASNRFTPQPRLRIGQLSRAWRSISATDGTSAM